MSVGKSVPRLEDGPLLRGTARFIDDHHPQGCLHVAFLRSPLASGRVTRIDASGAGALAAFTAADLEGSCDALAVHLTTPGAISPDRPVIARDRVRFAGE